MSEKMRQKLITQVLLRAKKFNKNIVCFTWSCMTCIETVVNLLALIFSIVFIEFGPSVYTKGSHKKKLPNFGHRPNMWGVGSAVQPNLLSKKGGGGPKGLVQSSFYKIPAWRRRGHSLTACNAASPATLHRLQRR